MSKTPYEIRLDLLKLSKDTLTEIAYSKRQALTDEFHASRQTLNSCDNGPKDPKEFPTLPELPDTDAIIAEAEKLNSFVSKEK